MKKIFWFLILFLLVTACSGQQNRENPGDSLEIADEVTFTSTEAANLGQETPMMEQSSGPLTARIFSMADTTINSEQLVIQGQANEEVVVTVNDELFTSQKDMVFALPVDLEEGPNLIEIVISDSEGNEVYFSITAVYEP